MYNCIFKIMSLNIFWIRHGLSCNNKYNENQLVKAYNYLNLKDPSIVLENMLMIIKMNKFMPKKMNNIQNIYCSQMKRAILTAIITFPNHFLKGKINIIKGINEIKGKFDFTQGNIPQSNIINLNNEIKIILLYLFEFIHNSDDKDLQKFKLYKFFKIKKNTNNIDIYINKLYNIVDNKEFNNLAKYCENEENVITSLTSYLKPLNINKISIVSHSKYIKKYIIKDDYLKYKNIIRKDNKINNNQIVEKKYSKNQNKLIKIYPFGNIYKNNIIHGFYNNTTLNNILNNKNNNDILSLKINTNHFNNLCKKNMFKKLSKKLSKKSSKNQL